MPVGVFLEQPDHTAPSGWSGIMTEVIGYTVRHELNMAGSWTVQVRATAQQAAAVRTGWKVSLKEQRLAANPDIYLPEWILRYGRVLRRVYHLDPAGGGVLELQGETWLGQFANTLIHTGQDFTQATLSSVLTALQGLTPDAPPFLQTPTRTDAQPLTVTFNDQTVLAVLIKLAELTRTAIGEPWESDTWEFNDQNDLPVAAGGAVVQGVGDLYLRQVQQGDPSQAPAEGFGPGFYGFGIIQGLPVVSYEGRNIANKITPVGTDYDGSPLTLAEALAYDSLYAPQFSGAYYFIEDTASQAEYGTVEMQLVRSDIKNPSNTPYTRSLSAAVLLAVASGEMLRRRSETETVSVQLINGAELSGRPGQRVYLRYKGEALLPDGTTTWLDLDKYMLIATRTDTGAPDGSRLVTLDLVAPVINYETPNLPAAVPIPTPLPRDKPPTPPAQPPGAPPPVVPPASAAAANVAPLADALAKSFNNNGAYQPCCADQTTDINAGAQGPLKGDGVPNAGGIYAATFGGDNGGTIIGGKSFPTPPTGSSAIKRAFFVMGTKITGMTCAGGLTYVSVFSAGDFSIWQADSPISGAASGLVTVSHSAADGDVGAEAWRVDVADSTADLLFIAGQLPGPAVGNPVFLAVIDEGGRQMIVNDIGSNPMNGPGAQNMVSVAP